MLSPRLPTILILALVATASLAGCHGLENLVLEDPDNRDVQSVTDTEPSDPGHTGHSGPSANETHNDTDSTMEANKTSRPPHASLLVNETSEGQSGIAPLTVRFNLAAETQNTSRLNWAFDPDDGTSRINGTGEDLPLAVEHTYTDEGEYNATFMVEDEAGRDVAAIYVNVTAPDQNLTDTNVEVELLVHTDIGGDAGEDPGNPSEWPGTARCDLEVMNGANAGEVLDSGVEVGCIEEWSYDEFESNRFVISVDDLEAHGVICVTWPVACQYWEFRVNGEPAEFGIDDYTAAEGDLVEFFFYTV